MPAAVPRAVKAGAPRGFAGLSHEQLLAAVPAQNAAVRVEARGEALVLWLPVRRRWWLQRPLGWLLPLRREKGIELDRIGGEVWRACDGERTVERIVEDFAERHQLGFHAARLPVVHFLQSLVERNRVALLVPEPARASAAAAREESAP
jgi:coenzyme PQQ synthesis protein D (PqqD)